METPEEKQIGAPEEASVSLVLGESLSEEQMSRDEVEGDFSMNGMYCDGTRILTEMAYIRPRRPGSQEKGGNDTTMVHPQYDLEGLEAAAGQKEGGSAGIYMSAAVDLFQRIDAKLAVLAQQRGAHVAAMEECRAYLAIGDADNAMAAIYPFLEPGVAQVNILNLSKSLKGRVLDMRMRVNVVRDKVLTLRRLFVDLDEASQALMQANLNMHQSTEKLRRDHTKQLDTLIAESNEMKERLLGMVEKYVGVSPADSKLEDDLLNRLDFHITQQEEQVKLLKSRLSEAEMGLKAYEQQAEAFDLKHLRRENEELKHRYKNLQSENLKFSQAIQRLSDKNIKHKQELILFNDELKQAVQIIHSKNDIIDRQQELIKILQSKVGGSRTHAMAQRLDDTVNKSPIRRAE